MKLFIPKGSLAKLRRLYQDGFSISELSIMYNTTSNYVERALEDE